MRKIYGLMVHQEIKCATQIHFITYKYERRSLFFSITNISNAKGIKGIPDSFQSFAHGVLRPWRRITARKFDLLSFTAAIQSTSWYAKLRSRFLHRGLAGANRIKRFIQIILRPRSWCSVEWRRQADSFSSSNFIECAAWNT